MKDDPQVSHLFIEARQPSLDRVQAVIVFSHGSASVYCSRVARPGPCFNKHGPTVLMRQPSLVARKVTQAHLSEEAFDGFARWTEHHGVDRTSIIEAFGRFLNDHDPATSHRLSTAQILATAAEVHVERKARPQK
jgi:hypothetical protein